MGLRKLFQSGDERNPTRLQYAIRYGYKTLLSLVAIVVLFVLVKKFLPSSTIELFEPLSENAPLLFSVFFVSESILGLLFPDLFIWWAVSEPTPVLYVSLLGILSYAGGIVSFLLGKWIGDYKLFEQLVRNVRSKYTHRIQKWGGFFVVLAALTPIPFSPVSMLCGSLGFSLKKFLIYSLSRIPRFLAYGVVFYYAEEFSKFFENYNW